MLREPRLYCNTGEEDRNVIQLLTKERIPFINLGPTSEEPTPFIEYGPWRFSQIQGIQEFIWRWQNKKLPYLED